MIIFLEICFEKAIEIQGISSSNDTRNFRVRDIIKVKENTATKYEQGQLMKIASVQYINIR